MLHQPASSLKRGRQSSVPREGIASYRCAHDRSSSMKCNALRSPVRLPVSSPRRQANPPVRLSLIIFIATQADQRRVSLLLSFS
jgi:hypothetical protein